VARRAAQAPGVPVAVDRVQQEPIDDLASAGRAPLSSTAVRRRRRRRRRRTRAAPLTRGGTVEFGTRCCRRRCLTVVVRRLRRGSYRSLLPAEPSRRNFSPGATSLTGGAVKFGTR